MEHPQKIIESKVNEGYEAVTWPGYEDEVQETLVLIKPDGVRKGLTSIELLQDTDFAVFLSKTITPTLEQAKAHYAEHEGKEYFDRITKALTIGEIFVMKVTGPNAVKRMREIIGSRNDPNTIRGKYSTPDVPHENAVHASDSVESAQREIKLWF